MTERIRRISLAALVVAASFGASCTNSDPLAPAPGEAQVIVEVSPAGAAGFDNFTIFLLQLGIQAASPGAEAAFGPSTIATVDSQIGINMSQATERVVGTVPLPAGLYRIGQINVNFGATMFQELNPVLPADPCNPSNCLQYVAYRNSSLSDPSDPDSPRFNGKLPPPELSGDNDLNNPAYAVSGISTLPTITVHEGVSQQVRIVIDGAGLAERMAAAYHCTCTGFCASLAFPAPCVTDFVKPSPAEFLSHFSVE